MLDKSLPYFNLIMKRDAALAVPVPRLPEGYLFKSFSEGDEEHWAVIEAAVGEFDSITEAQYYFEQEYLTKLADVRERVLFVRSPVGEFAGTVTAWWNFTGDRRDASLHWLAVKPEFQGLGLAKALVQQCLLALARLEGNKDVYLHTQTWSYKAVDLYLQTGFKLVPKESFGSYRNDYEQAMPWIQDRLRKTRLP